MQFLSVLAFLPGTAAQVFLFEKLNFTCLCNSAFSLILVIMALQQRSLGGALKLF